MVAASLGAIMLIGCGGGGGSVSVDNLADAVANSACDRLERCGAIADHAACVALYKTLINEDNLIAGVHSGLIKYDGGKAQECLDALAGASCDTSSKDERVLPQACTDAIKGTVADGGACKNDDECVSSSCNQPTCSMACCPGTCDPTPPAKVAIGQSCAAAPCADGAYCNSSSVCAALLAAGQTCSNNSACTYGTVCAGASGAMTCTTVPKAGEACINYGGGLSCVTTGLDCDATQHCVALLGPSATCDPQMSLCKLDLACDATAKTCGPLPAIGKPCQGLCATGAYCAFDQTTGTAACAATKADGQACQGDNECTSNNCDNTTMMCAARVTCA